MIDNKTVSVVCPICKNPFDAENSIAKCPVCGYTASKQSLIEKSSIERTADEDVELYRLMSSADTFFARKCYDEAYIAYTSVLDRDRNCLKADFRRELTSNYLMLETSSVYLSCDNFFSKVEEVKESLALLDKSDSENQKLKLTVCRDIADYISVRSDYEKRYAMAHKNSKTVEVYMSNVILLFEYVADVMKYLKYARDAEYEKIRAYLIIDCCALAMKLRGMLLAGAEYVETTDKMDDLSGEESAKNVSKIRRRMLSQEDSMRIEVMMKDMENVKKDMMDTASPELYNEIKTAKEKSETDVENDIKNDDSKRAEYELWRKRNEEEYIAADKKILIFGIAAKASLVMAAIMVLVFIVELIAFNSAIKGIIVMAVVFVAANVALTFLKKSAEKKKGFYSKVIEGDSANIRSSGGGFER